MAPSELPAPAVPPPAPAEWLRVWKRGSISFTQSLGALIPVVGWLEAAVNATNLDAIIDFGEATFPNDIYIVAKPWATGLAGSGKTYVGEFHLQVNAGVTVISAYPGVTCTQPAGINSFQFLLHAGGIAALVWGLDLGIVGFTFGESVKNLIVTGIAHGREL